jgi:hypothetical protein
MDKKYIKDLQDLKDKKKKKPPKREARHKSFIALAADFEGAYHFARMQDYSSRGFRVILYHHYPKKARLNFLMEGPVHSFECQGEIQWIKRHTLIPRRTYMAGIRIVGNKIPDDFMGEIKYEEEKYLEDEDEGEF